MAQPDREGALSAPFSSPDACAVGLVTADAALARVLKEQVQDLAVWADADSFAQAGEGSALVLWDAAVPGAQEALAARDPSSVWALGGSDADSLAFPLRLGVFLQRLRAWQEAQKRGGAVLSFGCWRLDGGARQLLRVQDGGAAIGLTDKETALMAYLMRAAAPVSRDEILADVWGYEAGLDTHTLETHIYRLRRKLMENEDVDPFIIEQGCLSLNPAWGKT